MGTYVSKAQYIDACKADLYAFLRFSHPEAITLKYGSALLRSNEHVSVKPGYNGFYNFRTGESGNNIDYLMNFLGYRYPEAVLALIRGTQAETDTPTGRAAIPSAPAVRVAPSIKTVKKAIELPEPSRNGNRQLYAFLMSRKIPAEVIGQLIRDGLLYQSEAGHNIVFASPGRDYCEIRGTNTFADRRCRRHKTCSNYKSGEHGWCRKMDTCPEYKSSPFHGCPKDALPGRFWHFAPQPDKPADAVYICEAAIDAVSLYVIHCMQGHPGICVYTSIGGAGKQKAIDRLSRHSNAILAVDNDAAGQACRDRNPALPSIIPVHKDWNEDLMKGAYYGHTK